MITGVIIIIIFFFAQCVSQKRRLNSAKNNERKNLKRAHPRNTDIKHFGFKPLSLNHMPNKKLLLKLSALLKITITS